MLNRQRELTLLSLTAAPTASSSAYCFNTPLSVAGLPQWIGYDFGAASPRPLCGYAFTAQGSSLWQSPRTWRLEGSHNGVQWLALHVVAAAKAWGSGERREYSISTAYFTRYRWPVHSTTPRLGLRGAHS